MQRGFTVTELLVVVVIVAVASLSAAPRLHQAFVNHQVDVAANQIQSLVQQARMGAVKEKASYRLLIHDESATAPNRVELQKYQGGSFTTLPQGAYSFPGAVRILGSSASSMTVSPKGVCSTGSIYVQADNALDAVSVTSTCLTGV